MAMTFGEKVRYARKKMGLTHEQLAGKLGISQPFISQIENGTRFPNHETTLLMAKVLGFPAEFFFREDVRTLEDIRSSRVNPKYKAYYVSEKAGAIFQLIHSFKSKGPWFYASQIPKAVTPKGLFSQESVPEGLNL